MSANHEAGPWVAEIATDERGRPMWQVNKVPTARYSVGTAIADLCGRPNSISKKEWATVGANAHLIAAAPDLLSALEMVSAMEDGECTSSKPIEVFPNELAIIRRAIAKAKGVSK